MAKISFAALALLALGTSSAALAAPCRFDANKIIGGFEPARIITSEADLTLAKIERMQGGVGAFAARALPAIDQALACIAARKQAFVARYDGAKLADAVRGVYQRYGIPPKDADGKDNYRSIAQRGTDLAPVAAITRDRFFEASQLLFEARALIAALPSAWTGYGRAAKAPAGLPAAMRADILKDARQHTGLLPSYLRYLEIALFTWSDVDGWLTTYGWPQMVGLQGRRAWHDEQLRRIAAEKAALDRAWKPLADRGRDQSAINPHYAQLSERERRERACVAALAAASERLAHRIQVAALIPYLEPFGSIQPAPVLPPRPAAQPIPDGCAASYNPETARRLAVPVGVTPVKPGGG